MIEEETEQKPNEDKDDNPPSTNPQMLHNSSCPSTPRKNNGKLMLDATFAPADISYLTDLRFLHEAREKCENIIDVLHESSTDKKKKPRTYRQIARKRYLEIVKKRRTSSKQNRKAIGKQLRYVSRNLRIIDRLATEIESGLSGLKTRQYQELLVILELYRQQKQMFDERSRSIPDRIVNLSQPHVRPMVRGKVNARIEFGAKLAMSLVNGYARIEKLSWDNFNECTTLQSAVETYMMRVGCYPEILLADKIYRNRENLRYCKERGIRLSGSSLGRPKKENQDDQAQTKQDASERNAIEGKFGEGKRSYGLGCIRARFRATSETVIALQLLVMNLECKLRILFLSLFTLLRYLSQWPRYASH